MEAISTHNFTSVRQCYFGDWPDARFGQVEREKDYGGAIGVEARK